jgi:hypothetical protein
MGEWSPMGKFNPNQANVPQKEVCAVTRPELVFACHYMDCYNVNAFRLPPEFFGHVDHSFWGI